MKPGHCGICGDALAGNLAAGWCRACTDEADEMCAQHGDGKALAERGAAWAEWGACRARDAATRRVIRDVARALRRGARGAP